MRIHDFSRKPTPTRASTLWWRKKTIPAGICPYVECKILKLYDYRNGVKSHTHVVFFVFFSMLLMLPSLCTKCLLLCYFLGGWVLQMGLKPWDAWQAAVDKSIISEYSMFIKEPGVGTENPEWCKARDEVTLFWIEEKKSCFLWLFFHVLLLCIWYSW